MSRPDPKPTALALADLLGYQLVHEMQQRAAAELDAANARGELAQQNVATAAARLEQTRAAIAAAYELTDGDGFSRHTGQITRAPIVPTRRTRKKKGATAAPKNDAPASNGASKPTSEPAPPPAEV
jgi:hypothetical protein